MSDRKPGSGWAKQKGGLVGFVEGPACSARRTAQDAGVQTAPSGSVPSVACSAVFVLASSRGRDAAVDARARPAALAEKEAHASLRSAFSERF